MCKRIRKEIALLLLYIFLIVSNTSYSCVTGLAYKTINCVYPGDEKMRETTRLPKIRRGGKGLLRTMMGQHPVDHQEDLQSTLSW